MTNTRLFSTFAGVGMLLSLVIGLRLMRSRSRQKLNPAESPPYSALLV